MLLLLAEAFIAVRIRCRHPDELGHSVGLTRRQRQQGRGAGDRVDQAARDWRQCGGCSPHHLKILRFQIDDHCLVARPIPDPPPAVHVLGMHEKLQTQELCQVVGALFCVTAIGKRTFDQVAVVDAFYEIGWLNVSRHISVSFLRVTNYGDRVERPDAPSTVTCRQVGLEPTTLRLTARSVLARGDRKALLSPKRKLGQTDGIDLLFSQPNGAFMELRFTDKGRTGTQTWKSCATSPALTRICSLCSYHHPG